MELLLVGAVVGRRGGSDDVAPQGALERRHRRRVGAVVTPDGGGSGVVVRRQQRRVALREDVEGVAGQQGVAEGGTLGHVVGLQVVQADVGTGADGGVQVLENLHVLLAVGGRHDARGRVGHRVEGREGQEGRGRVGLRHGSVAVGLWRAGVLRVDEPAVRAGLGLGNARLVRGGGRSGGRGRVGGVAGGQRSVVGRV